MKLLQVALEKQDYNLAAYILVYGLIKTRVALFCEGKRIPSSARPVEMEAHINAPFTWIGERGKTHGERQSKGKRES